MWYSHGWFLYLLIFWYRYRRKIRNQFNKTKVRERNREKEKPETKKEFDAETCRRWDFQLFIYVEHCSISNVIASHPSLDVYKWADVSSTCTHNPLCTTKRTEEFIRYWSVEHGTNIILDKTCAILISYWIYMFEIRSQPILMMFAITQYRRAFYGCSFISESHAEAYLHTHLYTLTSLCQLLFRLVQFFAAFLPFITIKFLANSA